MSQLSDLILKQVTSAASGSNLGNNVLNGLTDAIMNSFKQTATSKGGVEQLMALFTGKTSAANSSVTSLTSQIFTSQFASKLGLSSSASSSATSLIPTIIGGLVSAVLSKKAGGLDLSSILSSLGAASGNSTASKLGYIAGTLGKLFKKK